jgi:tRNA threonylcarbamoyladenosine biosynthesis protein TsaE
MACDSYLLQMNLNGIEATDRVAAILARNLKVGDFIALAGELGAGKTTFVRSLIRALVPGEEVPSPTFTLVQSYDAPGCRVVHADLYRVKSDREVVELGFDEALEAGALIVEWPDRMGRLMPSDRLDIILEVDDGAEERRAKLIGRGSWAQRLRVLVRNGVLS